MSFCRAVRKSTKIGRCRRFRRPTLVVRCVLLLGGMALLASPVRAQGDPVFPAPQLDTVWNFLSGKPVRDKIKFRKTDKLLRPPFSGAPEDSPKGLAAKIRAEEVDVPKRVEAVSYLGTIDCVAYPEAQEMLIDVLHNDKWEPVRLAAAQALEVMLSNCGPNCGNRQTCTAHCGNPDCQACNEKQRKAEKADKEAAKRAKKARRTPKPRIEQEARYDTCPGCCNKKVLEALAKTAYEKNENGCCFEPSMRVREAAVRAINACGIPCRDWWWGYMEPQEEVGPTAEDEVEDGKGEETPKGEVGPEKKGEEPPQSRSEQDPADGDAEDTTDVHFSPEPTLPPSLVPPAQTTSAQPAKPMPLPELRALNGYCIVGLQARRFDKAAPRFQSAYENRAYSFSSEAAMKEFERFPEAYAIKYSGFDPVLVNRDGRLVEGKYLRVYDRRFFLFASKENWEEFKRNADQYYVPQHVNLAGGAR